MAKIFIYYSNTGNGELVKDVFLNNGYEIRKVIPKHKLPRSFFFMIMTGGMLAGFNHKAKLKDFDYDISSFDEVVIGSPIWAGKLACPTNTILKKLNLDGKKLKFVLYSGGGSAPKAVDKLKQKYDADIIMLKEPKQNIEELDKLK